MAARRSPSTSSSCPTTAASATSTRRSSRAFAPGTTSSRRNGRDGNPDDAALELLCDSRAGNDSEPWTLWLTYGGAPGDGKPGLHERLAAFFDAREGDGQHVDVRFAPAGQHHTIPL